MRIDKWMRVDGQSVVDHVLAGGAELLVALYDLVDGLNQVLLSDCLPAVPDREHPRLRADRTQLGPRGVGAQPSQQLVPDPLLHRHGLGVDLEDVHSPLQVGQGELDLPVDSARPHQGRVEGVGPVGGHQHLDVAPRLEAVHLVDYLKHGPLHLVVSSRAVVEPGSSDGIDLVKEDDACVLGPGHLEYLADHPRPFPYVLLDQLRADYPDEAGVRAVCYCPRSQGLPGPRRPVEQHSFGRVDAEVDEFFGSEQGHFDNLPQLLELLFAAANVVVGNVGLVLYGHHGDGGVDLGGEGHLNLVLLAVDPHPHSFLDVGGRQLVRQLYHELGDLLEVDHVLGLVAFVDDLVATGHLQRLLSGLL